MKKAILISIKPEYVEMILNGKKTIEIRKSMPKCELPIDVYIYVAKSKPYLQIYPFNIRKNIYRLSDDNFNSLNGKVVAKFTLNKVSDVLKNYKYKSNGKTYVNYISNCGEINWCQKACLSPLELENYLSLKNGYAWHIENLQIFDKPMELRAFYTYCNQIKNVKEHKGSVYINDVYKPLNYSSNSACRKCKYYDDDFNLCRQPNNVNKAPQSWQYVYVEVKDE